MSPERNVDVMVVATANSAFEGMGLGPSIVSDCADVIGTSIQVESEPEPIARKCR